MLSERSSARFKEIDDAIRKARQECIHWEEWKRTGRYLGTIERSYANKYSYTNLQNDEGPSPDAFLRIAGLGDGVSLDDLLRISDPKPTGTSDDWRVFLEALYEKDDILFLGNKSDKTLHTRDEWIKILETAGNISPFFIINPLTGDKRMNTKSGTWSNRGDAAVKAFKYVLVEFDGGDNDAVYSLENQLAFFCNVQLLIVALTYSGGKSIHALVSLKGMVHSLEDWNREIKNVLYSNILRPLGADSANSNPSRMSRLPGHTRGCTNPQGRMFQSTGRLQRLIYLNPQPRDGTLGQFAKNNG